MDGLHNELINISPVDISIVIVSNSGYSDNNISTTLKYTLSVGKSFNDVEL
jgi:hypothetical protein